LGGVKNSIYGGWQLARITITVKILGRRGSRKISLPPRAKVSDLLKQLGYSSQVVVTRRNGRVVVEEERLATGDLVEIVQIVTGG
jgi:thiamine biosynthesis protein ThiS